MARIRSVHPGLWTDEAFVAVSPHARLLFIGLWNESDDQGVFEWKPIQIKMRLMPAEATEVHPLLEELERAKLVKRYTSGDGDYGAVRNFGRWQRPKKPNSIHPLPPEFRTYVALGSQGSPLSPSSEARSSPPGRRSSGAGSPPSHNQNASSSEPEHPSTNGSSPPRAVEETSVPQKGEKFAQMEEGGGRRERKKAASSDSGSASPRRRHAANGQLANLWTDHRIKPAGRVDHLVKPEDADRPMVNGYFLDRVQQRVEEATQMPVVPLCDPTLIQWLADGYEPNPIVDAIHRVAGRDSYRPPASLKYFDKAVREHPPTDRPLEQEHAA